MFLSQGDWTDAKIPYSRFKHYSAQMEPIEMYASKQQHSMQKV